MSNLSTVHVSYEAKTGTYECVLPRRKGHPDFWNWFIKNVDQSDNHTDKWRLEYTKDNIVIRVYDPDVAMKIKLRWQ